MVTAVFKYSYPNAKVRAMKGTLFTDDDFRPLLQAGSYHEFLSFLQTTHYITTSPDITTSPEAGGEISLPGLSHLLYKSIFIDYEKIIHAVKGEIQKFFILLYQQYELTNLKTILRGMCSHLPPEEIALLLLPTERYTLFSKQDVLNLRDVFEVVEHLQGSFFQYPLNRALHRFEKEREFFPLEMSLDLHYYRTLWDNMEKLPGEEQEIVRKLIGMRIDVLNVSWILRLKEQYQFSPEEVLNYTIHHGYAFRLRDRRKLAEAENAGAILAYLQNTPYGKAISGNEPLNTLHIILTRYIVGKLQTYFRSQPFQIGVILGYLLLKEFEASDILTIAEAKKYEYSFEDTQQYVIHA